MQHEIVGRHLVWTHVFHIEPHCSRIKMVRIRVRVGVRVSVRVKTPSPVRDITAHGT
jgi:hypothetical protein